MTLNVGKYRLMSFGKNTANETFFFQKFNNEEHQRPKNTLGYYRQQTEL